MFVLVFKIVIENIDFRFDKLYTNNRSFVFSTLEKDTVKLRKRNRV